MKKNIKFDKRVDFPTMIGDITAISLEKDLNIKDESFIDGNLILKGSYKLTEASLIEENFEYSLPIEINLTEKIDINSAKIDIADFYYEIETNNIMICHIELLLDAMEIIDDTDFRECDDDRNKEIEIPHIENQEEDVIFEDKSIDIVDIDNDTNVNVNEDGNTKAEVDNVNDSLFFHLDKNSETYGTFIVYILRQNESINSIIEKYKTSVEELEKYNDLNNLSIGTKIIIPVTND